MSTEKTELEEIVGSFTTKEISTIERKAGVPFDALENPDALGKITLMCGIAWMVAVRGGSKDSFDSYANRPFAEVAKELGINSDEQ